MTLVFGLVGLLSLSALTIVYGGEITSSNLTGTSSKTTDTAEETIIIVEESNTVETEPSHAEDSEDNKSTTTQESTDTSSNDTSTTTETNSSTTIYEYKEGEEWKQECEKYGFGTVLFYECKEKYISDYEAGQYINEDSTQSSSSFLSELEVKPEVELEIDGDIKELNGVRRIRVEVSEAQSVDIFLRRPGTLIEYFIGTVISVDNEHGYVMWDTGQTPNGTYEIVAKVTNVFGTYESTGATVNVNNAIEENITEYLNNNESLYWSDDIRKDIISQLRKLEDGGEFELVSDVVDIEDIRLTTGIDSDNDGLTDSEELRLGTNRFHPDTDGDGYLDGLEIARGFNPLIPSPGDKIAFTEPGEEIGVIRDDLYAIESIQVGEEDGHEILSINGRARPLAFVILYIYSEVPIVVTVRVNAFGKFEYKLSKTIPDGEHRVYVALTDSNGLIVEKSKPLAFVKEAQAIIIIPDSSDIVSVTAEKPFKLSTILLVTVIVVTLAILLAGIIVFRVIMSKKEEPPLTPPEVTG